MTLSNQKNISGDIMAQYPGSTLHQISPYIGKIRPLLARKLVLEFTKPFDWVWDPFCGSGTVPLECKLLNRNVIAADINPYACMITRAKLHAPRTQKKALTDLKRVIKNIGNISEEEYYTIPSWVKDFFHERTLKEAINLFSVLRTRKQYFNFSCLLGILHHQRPGFLSYPASHTVPYLRDRLFPRDQYPEAYNYRNPVLLLESKIRRTLIHTIPDTKSYFRVIQKSAKNPYLPDESINVVITSPPYMNTLDYARDNRLRLWFSGVDNYKTIKGREIGPISSFISDMTIVMQNIARVLIPGGLCILILGDLIRKTKKYDIQGMISSIISNRFVQMDQDFCWEEEIPDQRRVRKNGQATKREVILLYRRL